MIRKAALAGALGLYASLACAQVVTQANTNPPAGSVWIGRQVLTSTGAYTPTTGANTIDVTCVGGGGAGASAVATAAGQVSAASGGGSGGAFRKRFTSGFAGVTFTIGAPGANTAVTINATTYTASGGSPGTGGGAAAPPNAVSLGGTAGTGTNGDVNVTGEAGTGVAYLSVGAVVTGKGGNTPFGLGLGGVAIVTTGSANGNAGTGFGSGGSGAGNVQSQAGTPTGGAGQPGVCLIDEYR